MKMIKDDANKGMKENRMKVDVCVCVVYGSAMDKLSMADSKLLLSSSFAELCDSLSSFCRINSSFRVSSISVTISSVLATLEKRACCKTMFFFSGTFSSFLLFSHLE